MKGGIMAKDLRAKSYVNRKGEQKVQLTFSRETAEAFVKKNDGAIVEARTAIADILKAGWPEK